MSGQRGHWPGRKTGDSSVTYLELQALVDSSRLELADSALHAPGASFGGQAFYPDFVDKAAVLLVRLVKNHPLIDGSKRAGWVARRVFVEINGWSWATYPGVDESEAAVLAVASGGWDVQRTALWLRGLLKS